MTRGEETPDLELNESVMEAARILLATTLGGAAQGSTPAEIHERHVRYAYEACPLVGHHFLTREEVMNGGLLRENDSRNPAVLRDRFVSQGILAVRGALPADKVLRYLAESRNRSATGPRPRT